LKSQYAMNNAGCGNVFGFYQSPHNVGVEEFEIQASIYPNPTRSQIKIVLESTTIQSVQLYSLDGIQVMNEKADGKTTIVDLSNLQTGIYLVKINTNNGSLTKKVSKL